MTHIITKMLFIISPTMMTAANHDHFFNYENARSIKDNHISVVDSASFKIISSNQIFMGNPANFTTMDCAGKVALTANTEGNISCNISNPLNLEVEIDLNSDDVIDRIASKTFDPKLLGKWELDPTLMIYKTYLSPITSLGNTIGLPEFDLEISKSTHQITWKLVDDCGQESVSNSTFHVFDKKAPTPYCVSIASAIWQTSPPIMELTARDFDKGAYDNCTPQENLFFTFDGTYPVRDRIQEVHFFKGDGLIANHQEYSDGKAYKWLPSARSSMKVELCRGPFDVKISVWDEYENTDFCTVEISSPCGGCGISTKYLRPQFNCLNGKPLRGKMVVEGNSTEYPKTYEVINDKTVIPFEMVNEFLLEGFANTIDDSGITGEDFYLLKNHISGKKVFDSPYQYLAADTNRDRKVDQLDLDILAIVITKKRSPG